MIEPQIPRSTHPDRRAAALLAVLATLLLSNGCSQRQPAQSPASAATQSPSAGSPTSQAASTPDEAPGSVVKASFAPAGLATSYEAHFDKEQLQRITEQRKDAAADAGHGEYTFYGARLTGYRGGALQSAAHIELTFDIQGTLTASTSSAGKVNEEEITAIRTRAQILRSHAVARRGIRGHAS